MSGETIFNSAVSIFATLFIGIAKAGFGGGLGILVTPLVALVFPSREALGIILPLLIVADAFSLYYYWKKWDARSVRFLMPGALVGIGIGLMLIGRMNEHRLGQVIGAIVLFCLALQVVRHVLSGDVDNYQPKKWHGSLIGLVAGVTTTIAHAAGPVVALFLVPQRLPKEVFVGTGILVFALINWLKVPFFLYQEVCTPKTVRLSLMLMPFVPVGVMLGVWCNRRLSPVGFIRVIYIMLFVTGSYLLIR